MACRSMLRTAILAEQWLPLHFNFNLTSRKRGSIFTPVISSFHNKIQSHNPKFGRKIALNSKVYYHRSSSINDDSEQGPAQEAVLKAISEVSKVEGRVGQTTNVVIGGTVADDSTNDWLALDQKVNSYPTVRGFTAIGTGGNDFVQAMVVAVESVIEQSIPEGQVKQKISSGGKYVSVNIGPVEVVSSEQVQAVYNAMRRDDRMKYFL